MKLFAKSALCVAVAFAANASAEIKPLNADQFSVGGEVTVGGYYESEEKTMNTDATTFTLKTSYKNGGIVGYLEVDVDADWGQEVKGGNVVALDRDFVTDVDKAWVGYDFGFGTLSYGLENDTALDKIDGKGDMTFEFGSSASDASDAYDVIKFAGSHQGLVYGISYYEVDNNNEGDDKGYNGYFGYESAKFNVYAGFEKQDDDKKVATITGNADLGVAKVGVNYWKQETLSNGVLGDEVKGFYVSASKSFGELTAAAGYGDTDRDGDDGYFNVSGEYNLSANTYVGADIAFLEDSEKLFLKAGYTF